MLVRGTFDKKLHTTVQIDRGSILFIDRSDGIGFGEEEDVEILVAPGDVERCDWHVGITGPIDLVDVLQWGLSLHDVDDRGGIQHF